MPIILPYKGIMPNIHPTVYIADNAVITGDVTIGENSSIWFGCVLRGDVNKIVIGKRSNVQDGTVVHESSFGHPTIIGDDVTIGHMALIHACTIHDGVLIGMQSCVMDGTVIEARAMLAAGSLVPPGKHIASGQLWGGRPAKHMRDLNEKDFKHLEWSSDNYVKVSRTYKSGQN